MEYKLFDEYITLQALLKELGIIQSGGAIKSFLSDNHVYFNGEKEERRGKKIRIGDQITIPEKGISIQLLAPTQEEIREHKEEQAEKERVAQLVKEMNKGLKKSKPATPKNGKKNTARGRQPQTAIPKQAPVRFPGT